MPEPPQLVAENPLPPERATYVLNKVAGSLSFLADFIPADVQLLRVDPPGLAAVLAEARPSVRPSFYRRSHIGQAFPLSYRQLLQQAYEAGEPVVGTNGPEVNGMPMHQTAYPVRNSWGEVGGLLLIERNLQEEWRQGPKLDLYRTVIHELTEAVLSTVGTEVVPLSALLPGDALVILDPDRLVVHASYTAMNLARYLGIIEPLEGSVFDDVFAGESWKELTATPLFSEREIMWNRITISMREIPIPSYTLLILHDVTELKHKERELQVKSAIIQEVHHRVKNNLQTIAGLLRLQLRRSENPEVKTILDDSIKRISSIALVHEYLMHEDVGQVDLRGLVNDLVSATLQGVMEMEREIAAQVICPDPAVLPSAQATSIALVLTELIQNSVKHAFPDQPRGRLTVEMDSRPEELVITVADNGVGLPAEFDPERHANLGWRIIQTLVRDDLDGKLHIDRTAERGTRIIIRVPKSQ